MISFDVTAASGRELNARCFHFISFYFLFVIFLCFSSHCVYKLKIKIDICFFLLFISYNLKFRFYNFFLVLTTITVKKNGKKPTDKKWTGSFIATARSSACLSCVCVSWKDEKSMRKRNNGKWQPVSCLFDDWSYKCNTAAVSSTFRSLFYSERRKVEILYRIRTYLKWS